MNYSNKTPVNIVKLLLKNFYSKNEILEILKIKSPTFYKNMSLIRKSGLNVVKKGNKYAIKQFLGVLNTNSQENSLLAYLNFLSYNMLPYKDFDIFKNFNKNFSYLMNNESYNEVLDKTELYINTIQQKKNQEKINIIEKYIQKKEHVILRISPKKEITVLPIKVNYKNTKPILLYMDNSKEYKELLFDKITDIVHDEKYNFDTIKNNEVIFELYGRLMTSYTLKEGERILDRYKDRLIVANSKEEKPLLFKRLLRYDISCRIIFPKTAVCEFREIIEKSLDNIDKFQDNINERQMLN